MSLFHDQRDRAIARAHRLAEETLIDHAVIYRITDVGWGSDSIGGSWVAVPLGSVPDDVWMRSEYVAIPGEAR